MGIYILLKKISVIYFMFILTNTFAISNIVRCICNKVSYIANILDVDFEFFQPCKGTIILSNICAVFNTLYRYICDINYLIGLLQYIGCGLPLQNFTILHQILVTSSHSHILQSNNNICMHDILCLIIKCYM